MNTHAPVKLSVRGLTKRFAGAEVLHGLDFDVFEGEFLSILGPSGCGKTTTLRMLIGLVPVDEGAVFSEMKTSRMPRPMRAAWASCFRITPCSKT